MHNAIQRQRKRRERLKFRIQNFNQIEAIKMGLSTDDLTVLRWFIDFLGTNKLEKKMIEEVNEFGFWVDYGTLIDALPILLKDGNVYLERFLELERLLQDGKVKEYQQLRKKYHNSYRQKVLRLLDGPLSQILKKADCVSLGKNQGGKIYIYVDSENYAKLLKPTNMQTYLAENGIDINNNTQIDDVENVDNVDMSYENEYSSDKSVAPGSDKSVAPGSDKSVAPGSDKSVAPGSDKSVAPDSSIKNSSLNDSSIRNTSIKNLSDKIDFNLFSLFIQLDDNAKYLYLQNKFGLSVGELENIIFAMDLSIEDGSIKSERGSNGYWLYLYKTCKNRQEKSQLTPPRITD